MIQNIKHIARKYIRGLFLIMLSVLILAGCGTDGEHSQAGKPSGSQNEAEQKSTEQTAKGQALANQSAGVTTAEEIAQGQTAHDAEVNQAVAELQAHHYEEAVHQLDKVLAADPNNFKAYSVKGSALALEGNTTEGLRLIEQAHRIAPDYVPTYYDLAIAYKLRGELDQSKGWFEKVLAKDPQNVWSVYGIATIYADQGNRTEALNWLERAVKLDSSVKDTARTQDHFESFHGDDRFEAIVKP